MPEPPPPDDTSDEQAAIIADLALEVEHLAHTVADLKAAPSGGPAAASPLAPPPRPWCWPPMPHTRKADRLGELGDWMTQVLFTWPSAQRAVLACWPRHWDVVEELSMLYCCWKTAYLWEGATAGDAAEYLDRWLPNAITRIEIRLRPCGQGHQSDGQRRDDTAALAPVQDELRWL